MDTQEKIDSLRNAGFPIYWLDPEDMNRVRRNEYIRSYHLYRTKGADNEIAFVDLGLVASGEDSANQTSTVSRSNYRRLREDYVNVWIDISYSNANSLGAIVSDLSDDLIHILVGLKEEYPIYDESDLSELEDTEISDSWDQYHKSDVLSEITEKLESDDKNDIIDKFLEMDNDDIRKLFWQCVSETDNSPEHNGLDIIWPDTDIVVNRMIKYLTGELEYIPDNQESLF